MPDVLDQSEVDALLAAVDTGEVEEQVAPLKIFARGRKGADGVEVRPYDFKRPERVSKDQMRSLQTLHESFARNFGAGLSGFLRTIVEVKVSSCEQMTYSEFIAGLPNPTSFNLLSAAPLEGQMCLEISPLIIYPIIDRLLGGTNAELFIPQRPLTLIETRLISKITGRAIDALREAWSGIKELSFAVTGGESNPQLVQIVPPNEVVVVVGFELKMANRAGTMNLCIPYAVIEPLMEELAAQSWFSIGRQPGTPEFLSQISGQLSNASLEITGLLAETTITLRDLMHLSVGDIVSTEVPASEPVVVCIEGEKKHLAHIGQFKGQRALRIIRPIGRGDRV
ncbi:MAG: flagellar motor switch protein FliM [Phycisphaerales bacterium]|nr:flagellar motor switch protein FliM [Phycisphaerales bacterium]